MDVAAFLESIRHQDFYTGQLEHVEVLAERPGRFAEPARPLPSRLAALLAACDIERLYSHQVAVLDLARAGHDVVVVTGTASGKTLSYNLPILETALDDPEARALYLFPTKALAQDQHKGLVELLSSGALSELTHDGPPLAAGVFDGDTPTSQRRRIQAEAQLVLVESRHAARLDLALPSQVGPLLQQPPLRGCRRDSHLSRHLGSQRSLRAQAARAHLRTLWLAAGDAGCQRHDRQSWRASRPLAGSRGVRC